MKCALSANNEQNADNEYFTRVNRTTLCAVSCLISAKIVAWNFAA